MNVLPSDIATVLGGEKAHGREVRDFADLDAAVVPGCQPKPSPRSTD